MRLSLPYRKGVCIFLYKGNALLIVKKKSKNKEYWSLPQGGVHKNESEKNAVIRELKEELNLSRNQFRILKKSHYARKYDWPKEDREKLGFAGQEQSVWIVELLSTDSIQCDLKELVDWNLVSFNNIDKHIRFNDLNEIIRLVKGELDELKQ